MTEIQDYSSRVGDPASQRFETFSYLQPMDAGQIRKQVGYMVERGWNCAIEHVEPARAAQTYWYMWKLPMFGERDVDTVMNELTACRNPWRSIAATLKRCLPAPPGHHCIYKGP
jgi:ribulose-bisphosphate carboxylase small chain